LTRSMKEGTADKASDYSHGNREQTAHASGSDDKASYHTSNQPNKDPRHNAHAEDPIAAV